MAKKKKSSEPKEILETPDVDFDYKSQFFLKGAEEVEVNQKEKIGEERLALLQAFANKMNKVKSGVVNISRPQSKMIRISTGILSLDLAIGGGLPVNGKMSLIWGPQSQGKSEICLRVCSSFQGHCAGCARPLDHCICGKRIPIMTNWTDIENSWDDSWSISKGIDPDLVTLNHPDCLEDTVDYMTEAINSKLYNLHILDSIAMSAPEKELEDGQGGWQQGLAARIQNKGWRAWTTALTKSMKEGVFQHLIVINQPREKIGIMFGDPNTKPGGKAQEFMPSIIIRTQAAEYQTRENAVTGSKESYSVTMNGYVEKNKTAPAKAAYSFLMYTKDYKGFKVGHVDERGYLLSCIEKCGWLEKHTPVKWSVDKEIERLLGIQAYEELEETVEINGKKVTQKTGEIIGDVGCSYDEKLDRLIFKTKGALVESILDDKERYSVMRNLIVESIMSGKIKLAKVEKPEEELNLEAKNG